MSKRHNKKGRELDVVVKIIVLLTVALDLLSKIIDLLSKIIR